MAGRYEIVELLGRGGNGAVYRARQRPLNREVALKVLLPEVALSGGSVERFAREATLVQQLEHPNTVRLYDFGTTEHGLPFMALELLRGRTLEEEVRRGPMTPQRVGHVASQVLKSLSEAHTKGIIHRDIKPSNVYLADYAGEPDFAKVLDFGVARPSQGASTNITKDGQIVGTPTYMAPEQVQGGQVGPPADLQALGLVMAEALTGEPVYAGASPIEVWLKKSSEDPVPLPHSVKLSSLGMVIERATRKAPSERYQSAAEMLAALEAALSPSSPNVGRTVGMPASFGRRPDLLTATVPLAAPLSPRKPGPPPPSLLVPSTTKMPPPSQVSPPPSNLPSAIFGPHTARPAALVREPVRQESGSTNPPAPRHSPSGPPPAVSTNPPISPPPVMSTLESEPQRTRGLATFVAVLAAIVVLLLAVIGAGVYWVLHRPVAPPPPVVATGSGKLGAMTPEEVEKRIEKAGWTVKRRDVQDYGYGYKIALYDARRDTTSATVQFYDYESVTTATMTAEGLAKQDDSVQLRDGGKILWVKVWQDQATSKQLLEALVP